MLGFRGCQIRAQVQGRGASFQTRLSVPSSTSMEVLGGWLGVLGFRGCQIRAQVQGRGASFQTRLSVP